MAIIIGITGGIGSGKTSVMKYIESLGYKVYYADEAGKKVLQRKEVIDRVVALFDANVLNENGELDRAAVGKIVFSNPEKLEQLNAIVHPLVAKDFLDFVNSAQEKELIFKESAILFESKSNADCDYVILITAPEEIRIQRVMQRDKVTAEVVKNRMKNQWPDELKMQQSDYVVNNLEVNLTNQEIFLILAEILNKVC